VSAVFAGGPTEILTAGATVRGMRRRLEDIQWRIYTVESDHVTDVDVYIMSIARTGCTLYVTCSPSILMWSFMLQRLTDIVIASSESESSRYR